MYASTEAGCPVYAFYSENADGGADDGDVRTPQDWEWIQFLGRDELHTRMVPQGDGTYELQLLVRGPFF